VVGWAGRLSEPPSRRTIAGVDNIAFVKGHGTRNDFVLLPDPDGALALTAELAAALCDRRSGIGADGVLRIVRAAADPDAIAMADSATWFMDYRNSDGSISETCGNGLRVFARFLVDAGLAQPGRLPIATRGGVVAVDVDVDGDVTVDIGAPTLGTTSIAVVGDAEFEGVTVSMGNPHLVCVTGADLETLDLTTTPDVDPLVFPDGVNVEFVNIVGDRHAVMRVHERGSGETQSCGSGACAVAAVLAAIDGSLAGEYLIDVPGGRLSVRFDEGGHLLLRGPAVLVAEGFWRTDRD
jgi:diaminopimelate epimerase